MLLKLLLMFSLSANATEPAKFTILEYKAPAPFAGILFDEQAMAKILANYDVAKYLCETNEYNLFIMQKDKEINILVDSLKKTSPRYRLLWFTGGVVVGSAATYGAYKVFNER